MTEPIRRKRWKFLFVVFLTMLALAGGAAFSQRTALQSWYYAYRLERAPETERQAWADKMVGMGEPAAPRLLGCFRKDDTGLCKIARIGLEKLLEEWGPKDERSKLLGDRFFEEHGSFSPVGQVAALQLLPDLLPAGGVEGEAKARIVVAAALKSHSSELRFQGIKLAARAELNLLPTLLPLLDDPEADVRGAAMLALGPIREGGAGAEKPLISDDDLLRFLHDPDPEVRRICEMSLRSRGLRERDVRLGKMLVNPDPMDRLQLLIDLPGEEEIGLARWLQRLSNDPDSAVRAGAARVAAERHVDFAERLEQMMREDPDSTVRKIAEHYRKLYR